MTTSKIITDIETMTAHDGTLTLSAAVQQGVTATHRSDRRADSVTVSVPADSSPSYVEDVLTFRVTRESAAGIVAALTALLADLNGEHA